MIQQMSFTSRVTWPVFLAVLVVMLLLSAGCVFRIPPGAELQAQSGSLDTAFNPPQGYLLSTDAEDYKDRGVEVAVQNDGKILTVGYGNTSRNEELVVSRYTADGYPDRSFGSEGTVRYGGGSSSRGLGLDLQADGKILATGYTYNGSSRDLLLLRYTTDGTPDVAFGKDGVVTFSSPGPATDIGFAVTCEADGGIMVAGEVSNRTRQDLVVLHYTPAGVPDTRFGSGGVFMYGGTGRYRGFDATVQRDGKIVVTGSANITGGRDDLLLLRLTPDGRLDPTFGAGGVVTYAAAGDNYDYGNYVAVQDNGKIVVSGAAVVGTAFEVLLLRYNPDGTPDLSFGENGALHHGDPYGRDEYSYAHVIQPDGKIVITGYTKDSPTDEVLVMRFNPDGTVDTGFGREGHLIWNGPGNQTDYGQGIALQPDGKIVVTGFSFHGASEDLLLMRVLP